MPTTPAGAFPSPLDAIGAGPFSGMTDVLDPILAKNDRALLILNAYCQPGYRNTRVLGRPGFAAFSTRVGSSTARTGQFVGQFTKIDGTSQTVAICGGKFYTVDWGALTLTEALTAGELAGAAITLSTTARVYTATLADHLVISDSTNTPWMWDGTAHGGLAKLTNAPIFYGPLGVYYAKLFAVKQPERSTIVWSEEADPTTGYEAGGFNNAWTLSQTASETLYGVVGTNESLYIHRQRSWTSVSGAVSTDFQTAGTRSTVSETIGSTAPACVIGSSVYFVDADARPYHIPVGGEATPSWQDCLETVRATPRATIGMAQCFYYPPINALVIALAESGSGATTQRLIFRLDEGAAPNFTGVWRGYTADYEGMAVNGSLEPTWLHFGNGDGYLYYHGNPDGVLWNDALVSGAVAIQHSVTAAPVGYEPDTDKYWDLATLITASDTDLALSLFADSPYGVSATQSLAITGTGDRLDSTFLLDESRLAGAPREAVTRFGPAWFGRWVAPTVLHQAVDERFALVAIGAPAVYAIDTGPLTP